MFVTDNLTIFHTEFVGMFMIYHHARFQIPSYGLLVVTIKPKGKYKFHAAAMLFYSLP
jgi:hypothetical protein